MAAWNDEDPVSHQNEAAASGTARGNLNSYGGLTQRARGLYLARESGHTATNVVRLHKADEIVMQDGSRVADWPGLAANMAASGANGYLGGTNAIANWYRVVALRQSATGTRALGLAHHGSYINDTGGGHASGDDAQHGLQDAVARAKLAQGFQVSTAAPQVYGVRVRLVKVGTPTANMWLTIETDNAGVPSGTALATSDSLLTGSVSAVAGGHFVMFVFRSPPTLASGTQYHLVLNSNGGSAGNHVAWRYDSTASTYTGGALATYDSGTTTWTTTAAADFMFEIIKRDPVVDIAANLPAGYDQYAVIGWAYYTSGGEIRAFRQIDQHWIPDQQTLLFSSTATLPTLTDVTAFIPPVPITLRLAGTHSLSTAINYYGGVPSGLMTRSGAWRDGGNAQHYASAANDAVMPVVSLQTELQRLYFSTTAGTGTPWLDSFEV